MWRNKWLDASVDLLESEENFEVAVLGVGGTLCGFYHLIPHYEKIKAPQASGRGREKIIL